MPKNPARIATTLWLVCCGALAAPAAPPPTGHAAVDEIRRRMASAPTLEPAAAAAALEGFAWDCDIYSDADWGAVLRRESVSYAARRPSLLEQVRGVQWLFTETVRDPQGEYAREYLYHAQGLAGANGFLCLRVIDDSTVIKEYMATPRPGHKTPSVVNPSSAAQFYALCRKNH